MVSTQGVLFSEPTYSETGVWCELAAGLDPADWAVLCRRLGALAPADFQRIQKMVMPDPDSLKNRFKRLFTFDDEQVADVPLVCLGPEGLRRQKD